MSQIRPENSDSQRPDANSTQQVDSSAPQNIVQGNQNRVLQGRDNKAVLGDNNTIIQGIVNLTVYDRFDVSGLQDRQASNTVKSLTVQEYRQRKVLLNKVEEFWIEGVLEKSLHTKTLIEIGLEEQLDAVKHPFSSVQEIPDEPGQILPSGTSITEVFNQLGEGRTLLILGEPGAGKTTILLKLTQDLIALAKEDLSYPLPVVLNLSSWASKRQKIADWLVQELNSQYHVSKSIGKTWVEEQQLLLMLDGLDEVKVEHRETCVQALNQFLQEHGLTEMVVCSRIQDYKALSERLTLQGAICIQALSSKQIEQYLDRAGEQLIALKTLLEQNDELREFATSPLILSVMSLAYRGCSLQQLLQSNSAEKHHARLFNAYIERMLRHRGNIQGYSKEKAKRWLIWLARYMSQESQTILLIERMQPNCLQTKFQQCLYSISIGLVCVLIGVFFTIGITRFNLFFNINTAAIGLISSLSCWGIYELIFDSRSIHPIETLKWSWLQFKNSFILGLIFVPICIVLFIFITVLFDESLYRVIFFRNFKELQIELMFRAIYFAIIVGLALAIIFGLVRGFTGSGIEKFTVPNQGIRLSVKNALISSMIGVSGLWLASNLISQIFFVQWNFIEWGTTGLIFGLAIGGGEVCIKHFFLRLILCWYKYTPWNYSRFLDYATEHILLQKVGGAYIFIHRMLLEHLAQMELN